MSHTAIDRNALPETEWKDEPDQLPDNNTSYALIIGINEYDHPEHNNLHGAVSDADDMEDFLLTSLTASPENIINLRGTETRKAHHGEATRQSILDAFEMLETLTRRTEYPCIIIFYAGHGASSNVIPPGWEDWATDGRIEMLCPSDMSMEIEGKPGRVVEGIPDRTICSLLNALSEKRGSNITLILDCCCSAGLNRHDDEGLIPRCIMNPPPITVETNPIIQPSSFGGDRPLITRDMRVHPGFGSRFDSSHVLLAACGRQKQAFEKNGRGMFSKALLHFLRNRTLDAETYLTLMHNLQMPKWQTPHCMGKNADRPLFNGRGDRSDPSYLPCRRTKAPNGQYTFTLCAGLAEGIKTGEQFTIYENLPFEGQKAPPPILSAMSAVSVGTTSSILQCPKAVALGEMPQLPTIFYARRIDWRNDPTAIYCRDRELINSIFLPVALENQLIMVTLAPDPTRASLILSTDGDDVYIDCNDALVNKYIPSRFPCILNRYTPDDIRTVIGAWRHFNYHLHRRGENDFPDVRMEMNYLEGMDNSVLGDLVYMPTGENLLAEEPAHIEVSENDHLNMLGMTLYNQGNQNVYPYLFYFDPNNLTITPWTLAPHGAGLGSVDSPLTPGSLLSLGYGNGGATPWQFFFQDDRVQDIGFFKLFLSRSPANFSCLSQKTSPFDLLGLKPERSEDDAAKAEEAKRLEDLNVGSWGFKIATVIQTRAQH